MKSYNPKRIEIKKLSDSYILLSLLQAGEALEFKVVLTGTNDKTTELFSVALTSAQLKNIGSSNSNKDMKYNDQELIFRGIKSRIENLQQASREIENSQEAIKERDWLKNTFSK